MKPIDFSAINIAWLPILPMLTVGVAAIVVLLAGARECDGESDGLGLLSPYALAGMRRTDPRSNEAAIKYFLLGAFSTGFLLYGIALIYGATGSIKLEAIRAALAGASAHSPLMLLGLGMMLIGFGFKVAAVP